jgi:hypothetical protein
MNWKIRAIKWLIQRLRRQDDDFRLRLGHSLILANPEAELYLEILHGEQEEVLFFLSFEQETWARIRGSMQEMEWRLEREYQPLEEGT